MNRSYGYYRSNSNLNLAGSGHSHYSNNNNNNNKKSKFKLWAFLTKWISWQVINVANYIICTVCCFIQVYQVALLYFTYDMDMSVVPGWIERLNMPGLTLCSSIGVSYSELEKSCSMEPSRGSNLTNRQIDELRAQCYISHLKDTNLNEILSNGLDLDQFLRKQGRKCLLDEGHEGHFCQSLKEDNSIISFFYPYRCWTLFHLITSPDISSSHENTSVEYGVTQAPYMLGYLSYDAETSQRPIRPGEILRLQLNFTDSEKTFLSQTSHAYVYVHSNAAIGNNDFNRVRLSKGRFISTHLTIEDYNLLPPPFETKCINYTHLLVSAGKESRSELTHPYREPQSHQDCLSGCMSKWTVSKCNCWPPEVPYVSMNVNSSQSGQERKGPGQFDQVPLCFWDVVHNFTSCYQTFGAKCRASCPSDCSIRMYKAFAASDSSWPSKRASREFANFTQCCGLLSVMYEGDIFITTTYIPKYTFIQLLSTVGSIVGAWFGYCFADIIPFRKYLFQLVKRVRKKNSIKHFSGKRSASSTRQSDHSMVNGNLRRRNEKKDPTIPITLLMTRNNQHMRASVSKLVDKMEMNDHLLWRIPWYMNRYDPLIQYTFCRLRTYDYYGRRNVTSRRWF